MNINFDKAADAANAAANNSGNQNILALIFIVILVFCLYTVIKFSLYFKRSINYTKKATGNKLKIPWLYGLKWSTPALLNLIFLGVICLGLMIASIVLLVDSINKNPDFSLTSAIAFTYYGLIIIPFVVGVVAIIYNLIIFNKEFKDSKYHQKNYLYEVKKEIANDFKDLEAKEIKIELDNIKKQSPLAAKVLAKKIITYNTLSKLDTKKAYKFALEMQFISDYYKFYVKNFTFFGNYFDEEFQNQIQNPEIDYNRDYSSTTEAQIAWMEAIDNKFSSNQQNAVKAYKLYQYKNINQTLLRNQRKNSNLLVNTNDINYLGANPVVSFNYSVGSKLYENQDIYSILQKLNENTWKKLYHMI